MRIKQKTKKLQTDKVSTATALPAPLNNPHEVELAIQEVSPNPSKGEYNINNTDYVENLNNKNK